jgi:hypothetical protein
MDVFIYIYIKMTQEFLAFRFPQEFESRKGGEIDEEEASYYR